MVRGDVFTFLGSHRGQYDVVFADPPFHLEGIDRIPRLVREGGMLTADGLLILEHHEKTNVSQIPGFQRTREYGTIHFSFFGA